MHPYLLAHLCNPYTGEPLQQEGNYLVGRTSGQKFPILDSIPSIYRAAHISLRNRFYRSFYDRFAFAYDAVVNLGTRLNFGTEAEVRRQYIASLPIQAGHWVLESAVGTGSNLFHLPEAANYVGVDISLAMLKRARRALAAQKRGASLFHADAQFLPFHDNTFDLVFSMGGVQFFDDPFKAVSEMTRVAKPDAQIHVLDEAARAANVFKRMPAHAHHAANSLTTLTRLAPHFIEDAQVALLPSGQFYALTFTKPPAH